MVGGGNSGWWGLMSAGGENKVGRAVTERRASLVLNQRGINTCVGLGDLENAAEYSYRRASPLIDHGQHRSIRGSWLRQRAREDSSLRDCASMLRNGAPILPGRVPGALRRADARLTPRASHPRAPDHVLAHRRREGQFQIEESYSLTPGEGMVHFDDRESTPTAFIPLYTRFGPYLEQPFPHPSAPRRFAPENHKGEWNLSDISET